MSTRRCSCALSRVWLLLLNLATCAALAQGGLDGLEMATKAEAQRFTFKYQDIDDAPLPPGIQSFAPLFIRNDRSVYGFVFDSDLNTHPAFLKAGQPLTILPMLGVVWDVDERGTMAGSITLDVWEGTSRAALFHGTRVERLPRRPGERASYVNAFNDTAGMVIASIGVDRRRTLYLYKNRASRRISGKNCGRLEICSGAHTLLSKGSAVGRPRSAPWKASFFTTLPPVPRR